MGEGRVKYVPSWDVLYLNPGPWKGYIPMVRVVWRLGFLYFISVVLAYWVSLLLLLCTVHALSTLPRYLITYYCSHFWGHDSPGRRGRNCSKFDSWSVKKMMTLSTDLGTDAAMLRSELKPRGVGLRWIDWKKRIHIPLDNLGHRATPTVCMYI